MRNALAILLIIISSFFFIWSFNMSYGSHIVEERNRFWRYFIAAYVLVVVAIACTVISVMILV
jgi:hypothetical protein